MEITNNDMISKINAQYGESKIVEKTINPVIFMGEIDNEYRTAQICEIANITGVMKERSTISIEDKDIEEMLTDVYKPIFDEWSTGMEIGKESDRFKTEEEEGYIGAYAERRLPELYPLTEEDK